LERESAMACGIRRRDEEFFDEKLRRAADPCPDATC